MTTEKQVEQQGDDLSIGRAVGENIIRLRRIWPKIDGPDLIGEYRRVLGKAADAEMVSSVVEGVIDSTSDRTPPVPGVFAKAIGEANARRRREDPATRTDHRYWIDESALIDAQQFLEGCTNDIDRAYAERQVMAIRGRLKDRGAAAEDRVKVRFRRTPHHPADPPGTVRFAVIRVGDASGGDGSWPKGPRNGGLAAIVPLAVVVMSGAWRVIG